MHFHVIDEVARIQDEEPLVEHVQDVRLLEHVAGENRLGQSGRGFHEGQHPLRMLASAVGELVTSVFSFGAVSVVRHLERSRSTGPSRRGEDSGVVSSVELCAFLLRRILMQKQVGRGWPVDVLTAWKHPIHVCTTHEVIMSLIIITQNVTKANSSSNSWGVTVRF